MSSCGKHLLRRLTEIVVMRVPKRVLPEIGLHDGNAGLDQPPRHEHRLAEDIAQAIIDREPPVSPPRRQPLGSRPLVNMRKASWRS